MADTIREFMVALGFRVDDAGLKKFSDGIVTATKRVVGIAAALSAAQVAVTEFVKQAAEQFERLYYTSQRAGSTVDNLRALQYAFNQTGMSADSAGGMLETFRMSMRMNPAMEGLLNGFGVLTRGLGGRLRDTKDVVHDFVGYLKGLGPDQFWLAARWAEMFGITPQQLLMQEEGFDRQDKLVREHLAKERRLGFDPTLFAERSVEFMNAWRSLGDTITIEWDRIASALAPRITAAMREIDAELQKYLPDFNTRMDEALSKLDKLFKDHKHDIVDFVLDVRKALTNTIDDVTSLIPYIDTLVTKTVCWKVVLEAVGDVILYRIFGPLGLAIGLFEQLKGWMAPKSPEADRKIPDSDVMRPDYLKPKPGQSSDELEENWKRRMRRDFERLGEILHGWFFGSSDDVHKQSGTISDSAAVRKIAYRTGGLEGNYRENSLLELVRRLPYAIWQEFVTVFGVHPPAEGTGGAEPPRNGFDPSMVTRVTNSLGRVGRQAAGDTGKFFGWIESSLGLPEGVLDAVWAKESGRGRNRGYSRTGALGDFQFMPDTARRFGLDDRTDFAKSAYAAGQYIRANLALFSGDVQKALAGYNWGEGNVQHAAARWGGDWLRHAPAETQDYVRTILGGALGQGGGRSPVTINQHVNINVHGGGDPHRVAQEVAVRQRTVNADIIRNLGGGAIFA